MRIKRLFGIVAFLLLIPLTATLLTDEMKWSPFDFIVAGVLLTGAGFLFELVFKAVKNAQRRLIVCAALLGVFLLVWIEMAVGLFGTPFAGN